MKINTKIFILFCVFGLNVFSYAKDEFPPLTGPYMGQKTPGMTAEVFAPGIISKGNWEVEGVFLPNLKEFYFTLDRGQDKNAKDDKFNPVVIGFRQENNVWTKFQEFKRNGEVTFSPDGQRMHMAKGYKERTVDGWSERKLLGPMINKKDWKIMRLSSSAQNTYVFDDAKNKNSMRISKVVDGKRKEPKLLSTEINSGKSTAHPFIAPDESYLIWDSNREGGYGESDLYISFKQPNDSWGPAINMGEKVNSAKNDVYATVTSNGKYLMFNRKVADKNYNVDIFWVDAKVIENLRSN